MRVEYRVTRPEDFVRFGVSLLDGARSIGWTAWAGRRAVAMGGVVIRQDGEAWGHFGATEDYRSSVLRGLHRRTLKLLRRLDKTKIGPIRATCDMTIPRAAEWMARLGFTRTDEALMEDTIFVRSVWPS